MNYDLILFNTWFKFNVLKIDISGYTGDTIQNL